VPATGEEHSTQGKLDWRGNAEDDVGGVDAERLHESAYNKRAIVSDSANSAAAAREQDLCAENANAVALFHLPPAAGILWSKSPARIVRKASENRDVVSFAR
jgi:hypothetical protein